MKLLLTTLVVLVSLLAAPTSAQERSEVVGHPIFEPDRKARLALDYLEGHGVAQSNTEALKWWIIARSLEQPIERITPETPFRCGYEMAMLEGTFAAMEERMAHNQIAQAENMAHEWLGAHPQ